jgi:hypothetical protein
MMILRCVVLLAAALTLSNCCLSSSGCNNGPMAMTAAPAPAAARPVAAAPAWDGLNETPTANAEPEVDVTPPKKQARRKANAEVTSSQLSSRSRADLSWEEQQALDRDEEARLRDKLVICRNCSTPQ